MRSFLASTFNPKSYAFLAATLPLLAAATPHAPARAWAVPAVYAAVLALTTAGYGYAAALLRWRDVGRMRLWASTLCGGALTFVGAAMLVVGPA